MKYFLIFSLLLIESCSLDTFYTAEGSEIGQAERTKIISNMKIIVNSIKDKNLSDVSSISSDSIKANLSKLENTFYSLEVNDFDSTRIYCQYYIKNTTTSNINKIKTKLFEINFSPERITYVCMYPISVHGPTKWNLACVFHLLNNKYELTDLYLGIASHNDKSAIDYIELAKQDYNSGKIKDAFLNFQLSEATMKKGGGILRYYIEDSALTLYSKLEEDIRKQSIYPFEITNISGSPKILLTKVDLYNYELFPTIVILSPAKSIDSVFLNKECHEIGNTIDKYFDGLKKVNTGIIYQFAVRTQDENRYNTYYTYCDIKK